MKLVLSVLLLLLTTSLPAQEDNSFACADGRDNDGDGLVDCDDPDCQSLPNRGCTVCPDGLSFADEVILFTLNCGTAVGQPDLTLGVADWSEEAEAEPALLSLGNGGRLQLAFTNNQLSNSGSAAPDIWLFEVGTAIERAGVSLRPVDGATRAACLSAGLEGPSPGGFFRVGTIEGSTAGFDVDAVLPGYEDGILRFDAIELTGDLDADCTMRTPGADIDAVCAISTMRPVDCLGVTDGTARLDACGVCLEPDDPAFNQSCVDCFGVPNGSGVVDTCGVCVLNGPDVNSNCTDCMGVLFGTAVLDSCGLCLPAGDPRANQACTDCAGTPDGTAVVDECGACLEPTDPAFNQSCADCAGTPNGTAVLDDCGVCLRRDSDNFNQSCAGDRPLYVPTAFSPNGDGNNDVLRLYKPIDVRASVQLCRIYDRWGGLVVDATRLPTTGRGYLWNGGDAAPGVYAYYLEVKYWNGEVRTLRGLVTLLR